MSALLGLLGYPCPAEEAAQRVLDLREDPNQTCWWPTPRRTLAGMVCCDVSYYLPLGAPTCRITALAVSAERPAPGHRPRCCCGKPKRWPAACGAVRIELTSASHRTEAHAFYRACGYGDGALRFVKRLGDA